MYTVGQLAKLMDVSVRTLHYYDEIGLLKPSAKSEAGYRYYTKDDLIQLQQILVLKQLGFKLTQIKEMLGHSKSKPKKAEKWKQVFEMELEKIAKEKRRLEQMEQSLHAVLHSLELTGDVTTDYIVAIIQSVQMDYGESFLSRNFTKDEQSTLLKQMPNLFNDNAKTKKWINLLKKVHRTKSEPIDSVLSQQLAVEIMEFIEEDLQIDHSLIDKYWEKIRPDDDGSEKVLGLDRGTMEYIEGILDWYEEFGEGAKKR